MKRTQGWRRLRSASALGLVLIALLNARPAPGADGAPGALSQIVRQYALTSANDFPQRDPRDWRLLGSNDGGKTWVLLDARRDELFSERHQRRMFKIKNPAGFNTYRFQIERVRDTAAADSVQLAELEPLGETDDDAGPAPLEVDTITAAGENAPRETALMAFDGRPETKWLDHATNSPGTRASWLEWQYTEHRAWVITNVQQLAHLRNGAARGFPIRLSGVIVGPGAGHDLCFLDGSGHLEFAAPDNSRAWRPGQRVVIRGLTEWAGRRVRLRDAIFEISGPVPGADPHRIRPEQPLPVEQELAWTEVEGVVRFCTRAEGEWACELEDGDRSLSVHLFRGDPSGFLGQRVRLRGLCGGVLDSTGNRVAGTLFVAGPDQVLSLPKPDELAITEPASSPAGTRATPVLTSVEQVRRLSREELARGPRLRLRGVVTEIFGSYIQEGGAGVEVWPRGEAVKEIPQFGDYIELEGKGDWALGHGPVARAERIRTLGKGKLPKPERCTWSQLASGKTADQWVELDAVVRATDGSHLLLTCGGGQLMATIRSAPAASVKNLVDATVRVRGVSVAATDSRGQVQGVQLLVPSLEQVEIQQPAADPFSLTTRTIGSLLQVRARQEFIHRVKVAGVLTFREDQRFFLQDATGGALAIPQQPVVLNSPASGWSWMFWQSGNSTNPAVELAALRAGDRVEVVGFPETQGFSPILTEVLVRPAGRSAPVQPVKAGAQELAAGTLDSMVVSLKAVLLRQETVGNRLVLSLQAGANPFQALFSSSTPGLASIPAGSRVQVTGVCQVDPLPYVELGQRLRSFKLLVGSAGGLTVLDRPPWWTLKRVLVVTGALVVVLALAAAWIGILRRQVEERTRQLQAEIEQHKKTEAQLADETRRVHAEIEERKRIEAEVEHSHKQLLKASRLAGMAEVATNVLHNVGNVLNSVNVLGSVVVDQLQRSKVSSLGKLAALLNEHQADLGGFLNGDSRGRQLPGYTGRLAAHLADERARLLDKMRALNESVQHIKEIVAMQQNYARVSGVLETVPLKEIVEDALRIHNGAMARHQIKVVREYADTPAVTVDRHKVLQVLFNLLENAKYACDDGTRQPKQVTVRLGCSRPERIAVAIIDNGIGIPPENLPRIFAQEFSTRKGGHGFGLHSSLMVAQDMGATLIAHSDGPGRGACFTLELPASAPVAGNPAGLAS